MPSKKKKAKKATASSKPGREAAMQQTILNEFAELRALVKKLLRKLN
ncbi:hypothetical protein ABIB75_007912 [Bradyrhizobium sp. GM2.2]|jgi:hypothetical protein|nr:MULTISPECIES: hypothetical protein [unclassified Bradyrhizobium]MCK1333070.1 hypothetical protein [Bradyrhizobium sp. CW9]MCK1481557.1 hypothetical protein [Bradyrhizobium sp. 193]MCK1495612.1 hypothetical protein [Bradyrhizobium sp. 188]MCK1552643.1 hypothetical protein [Bradyrhizobium sp. 177]MCK1570053.1 hypothetical protein [Bradyrhizobium sp. 173]